MARQFHLIALPVTALLALAVAVVFVASARVVWNQNRTRLFTGVVCDCQTGEPVAAANIELRQQTILTWTQVHQFHGTSDAQGRFKIPYDVGNNIHVRTWKEGYLLSDDYSLPGAVRIGLIKESANEAALWRPGALRYSQNCKRAFECHTEALRNGVKVVTDQCGSLPPQIAPAPGIQKKPGS